MADLYMARIEAELPKVLQAARLERVPTWQLDDGYLIHTALAQCLGDATPSPFALGGARGSRVEILGYSREPAEALRGRARDFALPQAWEAFDFEALITKPMPHEWESGRRLGFRLRACPVVRLASATNGHRAGAEVDAFLAEAWRVGPDVPVDRGAVYLRWLEDQFERRRGARLAEGRVVGHRRQRLVRRTQGADRRARMLGRPEVHFEGTLEVTDPMAFQALLERGVGRHRAFGYGMLLLRPPRA